MDEIKKKNQMVIARYNENLDWLLKFKDIVIVYNKGAYNNSLNKFNVISLPNIGRESHTYLYHIITNYDNLADRTIFFQGKISDHKIIDIEDYFKDDDFIGKLEAVNLNLLYKKIDHHGKWKQEYLSGEMRPAYLTPIEWLTRIIGVKLSNEIMNTKKIKMVWGANFSVSKSTILKKPKIFYENAIRLLENHVNPEEGHYFERAWYTIFTNVHINKPRIGYLLLKSEYTQKLDDILNKILIKDSFKEIHVWMPIIANNNYTNNLTINYIPNNNKYIEINPIVNTDRINLKLKAKNDVHILIEFENTDNIYEIVLGGWNGTKSVVRNSIQGDTIISFVGPILNSIENIEIMIYITNIFLLSVNGKNIFDFENIYPENKIKNIYVKSCFGSESYWEYSTYHQLNPNIKINMCNNGYKDTNYYYINNYLDYYIKEIDLLEYTDLL
jgi:hypothetical protein